MKPKLSAALSWLFAARQVAAQPVEPEEANLFAVDAAIQADADESTAAATNSTAPATQATSSTATTTPWDTSGLPIYQVVKKTKDLWLLSAAIQAAMLDTALADTEYRFTLFAPVDDALFELPSGLYSKLTKEPIWMPQLQDFLLYHVVGGDVSLVDLAIAGNMTTVESINFQSDEIAINLANINLERSDKGCSNGVVHFVESAFIPPSVTNTVIDILFSNPDLASFVDALNTAGLVEVLSGMGPYTLFVPTNRAIAEMPEGAIDERYIDIFVKHHVLSDNALSTSLETSEVIALSNFSVALKVEETDDGVSMMINDANILAWDFIANNVSQTFDMTHFVDNSLLFQGILHIIDTALMPPLPIEEEVDEIVEDPDDATGQDEPSAKPGIAAQSSALSRTLSRVASIALGIIVSSIIIR